MHERAEGEAGERASDGRGLCGLCTYIDGYICLNGCKITVSQCNKMNNGHAADVMIGHQYSPLHDERFLLSLSISMDMFSFCHSLLARTTVNTVHLHTHRAVSYVDTCFIA